MTVPRLLLPLLLVCWASTAAVSAQEIEARDLDDPPAAPSDDQTATLEREAERHYAAGDLERAIGLYQRVATRQQVPQERVRVLILVAYLQHRTGRDTAAVETLTDGLSQVESYPFRPEHYDEAFFDLYEHGLARAKQQRAAVLSEQVVRGVELLRAGQYAQAREALQATLEQHPDEPTALYNLAFVDLQEVRYDDALGRLERIVALADGPSDVPETILAQALTSLGFLYNERQHPEEAERVLDRAVALSPDSQEAWTHLGIARRQRGRKDAAAQAFERAHQLAPDDPATINNLAFAYLDRQDYDSASRLLVDATARFPNRADLWLSLGRAEQGRGDAVRASEAFESAVRNDPTNAQGQAGAAGIYLAGLAYQRGDHGRSLGYAEQVIGWLPESVDAWTYRGLAYKALGQLDRARDSLETARGFDPARASTHNNLGSVYMALGAWSEAAAAFERALAIQPGSTDARTNLDAARAAATSGAPPPRRTAPPPPPPPAPPSLPALGLRYAAIDYSTLGIEAAMVDAVMPDSPASRAKLRKNDLILKVDGNPVTSGEALERYIYTRARDRKVLLDVLRDGQPRKIELILQ